MASYGVGGPCYGERVVSLEQEFEAYRVHPGNKGILEGWLLHNFSKFFLEENKSVKRLCSFFYACDGVTACVM